MLAQSVGFIVCSLLAAVCGRRTRTHWNSYKRGKGKPILHEISTEQLASLSPAWPLNSSRWPKPATLTDVALLEAYGRVAARTGRITKGLANGLLLLSGAWLGIALPYFVDFLNEAGAAPMWTSPLEFPSYWKLVGPIFVAAGAFGLDALSSNYARAAAQYRGAARNVAPSPEAKNDPKDHLSSRQEPQRSRGLRERIRRMLHRRASP